MGKRATVGDYLVTRLEQLGLRHIFGVPGDYVLGFFDLLEASQLEVVGTCAELGAGYAADAYARVNGLGALCVTYCVGGLSALNAVAGAYAEKSPVIVISGAPGLGDRRRSPLLHHCVRQFDTQLRIFREVTAAAAALEDPERAPELIDDTLATCVWEKRPVYLELPRDIVAQPCVAPGPWQRERAASDEESLAEAVRETASLLRAARRPAVLAGVEIHRFGLQAALVRLVERLGCPVAATLLGKSVIAEHHPQYAGVYEGAIGRERVRKIVEGADCLLILGAFLTDINLGIHTAKLDPARTVYARSDRVSIHHHHYEGVFLGHFLRELTAAASGRRRPAVVRPAKPARPYRPVASRAITVKRLFARLDAFLDDDTVVICDVGDSLFGGADLEIHRRTEFISPAYYTSMGFAVPAAVGAQIGRRSLRPVVIVGDGAFQMTGQELSTVVARGLDPIVIVLNNRGYTTERFIHEGPYNDLHNWAYSRMPELLRGGRGWEVRTEGDLELALAAAKENRGSFSLLEVQLEPLDGSEALVRLGKRLGKRVK